MHILPFPLLALELENADGIIMTGGVDIHPGLYGKSYDTIRCGTIDSKRDEITLSFLSKILRTYSALLLPFFIL